MDNVIENVIEWIKGDTTVTCTFTSNSKFCNKMKKLSITHKEIEITENRDGSIVAKIPLKWVKISPPRQVSEEQKEKARIRLNNLRK